jgi:chromosomal replication initiator protein
MISNFEQLWEKILSDVKNQINKQTFDMWLNDTKALSFDGQIMTIAVKDEVAKNHIEKSYTDLFSVISIKETGKSVIFKFVLENSAEKKVKPVETINPVIMEKSYTNQTFINPKYTFDSFVIGPNNELAFATAVSISKAPGKNYNPFFIYGDSGLGKTHLLHAIGNAILAEKSYLKVLYTSIEQFMNEFIQSIQNNTQPSFKIKYRNVDVLLIDDIQFIENKEGTQTEFFYTFEDLYKNGKHIIISSDRPPSEISNLAERLRTRFEWGLQADIKPPNIETREAILRKKAEIENIIITDDVLNYIAKRIKTNIRKLESALTKLQAISDLTNEPISVNLAKIHLKTLFDEEVSKQITVNDIIRKVAERMNVSADEIVSKSRHSSLITPRFAAMYLTRKLTNLTTIETGKEFGNRDHSTVINAEKKVNSMIESNENFKDIIEEITSELKS